MVTGAPVILCLEPACVPQDGGGITVRRVSCKGIIYLEVPIRYNPIKKGVYVLLCINILDSIFVECPHGFYGINCLYHCFCRNDAPCNSITGECNCTSGFTGTACEKCEFWLFFFSLMPYFKVL